MNLLKYNSTRLFNHLSNEYPHTVDTVFLLMHRHHKNYMYTAG